MEACFNIAAVSEYIGDVDSHLAYDVSSDLISQTMPRVRKTTRDGPKKPPRKAVAYNTDFNNDASAQPQLRLADSTRRAALGVWRRWVEYAPYCSHSRRKLIVGRRFCHSPGVNISPNAQDLPSVSLQTLKKFLHWHVNYSDVSKLSSLYVFARTFRVAYKLQTQGRILDSKLISEMRHVRLR